MQHSIEIEIADRLDHAGENKSKSEDQGRAIVRASEADEGIRRIAKAEKRAAHFKVKIGLRSACETRVAEIEDCAEVGKQKNGDGHYESSRWPLPENPDDFGPISHENPQMRMKTGQTPRNARLCPFVPKN